MIERRRIGRPQNEKAIVADFDKAPGQDALEEAADELLGGQGTGFELAGVGGAVAEGRLAIGQFQDAVVADGCVVLCRMLATLLSIRPFATNLL
jgi:hypothetical protein